MKQQRLFPVVVVIETGENNIDRTSLFAIVIIVGQPCYKLLMYWRLNNAVTLFPWLNNLVDNIVHGLQYNIVHGVQHNIVHGVQHNIVHGAQQNIVHGAQNNIVHRVQHNILYAYPQLQRRSSAGQGRTSLI